MKYKNRLCWNQIKRVTGPEKNTTTKIKHLAQLLEKYFDFEPHVVFGCADNRCQNTVQHLCAWSQI